MRTLWILLLACFWPTLGLAQNSPKFNQEHPLWNEVLHTYLTPDGKVRYAVLKAASAAQDYPLAQYLKLVQAVSSADFNSWPAAEQKAFLINAYNALTVQLIVDHYPVKSIRDIGGLFHKPWSVEFFSLLGGQAKTLDEIEHQLLRPVYKDCRIHAAVNCASLSCPPLRKEPYVGGRLDAQLDEQMRLWLADPSRNQFSGGGWKLSKIFSWYEKDFEDWGGGVKSVVNRFGPPAAKGAPSEISYLDYDWQLNEAEGTAGSSKG